MENRERVIKLENVSKIYRLGEYDSKSFREDVKSFLSGGKRKTEVDTISALDGVDLTIYKGETVGIIGRNGRGKSTMLKLLSRITAPSTGTIYIKGKVASMLQVGTGFHPMLTGMENIYVNGAILGMTRRQIDSRLSDIIDFSGIGEFMNTPVRHYSSGMYVKLGFSVAAHLDSDIVIMDEVLAVGDIHFQQKCIEKMRNIAKREGRTVLYVSHNMNTVRNLCDRCLVFSQGKIIYDGEVDKAIEIYTGLGQSGEASTCYEFTERNRPYVRSSNQADDFTLLSLRIEGKDSPVFFSGEEGHISIKYDNHQSREKAGFRLQIVHRDGVLTGSMLTEGDITLPEGENEIRLTFTTKNLMRGDYRADLIAYTILPDGSEYVLDKVYPGMVFSVTAPESDNPFGVWKDEYWGHVLISRMKEE
jgi:lipopolysaccharide transport system ATP-binding protein